jgi:hypothetical protein
MKTLVRGLIEICVIGVLVVFDCLSLANELMFE